MTVITHHTIQDYDIAVRHDGDGARTLLLVHGFTDSANCWQSLIETLASEYTVIAYDGRGHGQSGRIQAAYTIADLADECADLIQQLGLERPLVIGHSMGAAIAALLALRYPQRVQAVLLEDPPLAETVTVDPAHMQNWKAQILMQQQTPSEMVAAYYRTTLHPDWRETDILTRVEARYTLDPTVFDTMDWGASPRWQDWAQQVRVPGILITGDPALGALVTPAIAAQVCGQWLGLAHQHVANVGHHIRCSQPDAYLAILRQFLATH